MSRSTFYVVVFQSRDTSRVETSRTFATIKVARKWAAFYGTIADNARIMQGGPGGIEVR